MSAFSLLAEPIQRALWNMRWNELRPIQERAIPVVLQTDHDLIISARTAAGKTEAAFLPVLSAIQADPTASIRAIYVGPLKALINDQFRRVEELAALTQIPVHSWHGDVGANRKQTALQQPGGVLLITPESLEAMFVNRGNQLAALFHSLSFVVLDELHVLLGTERGLQLRSLLFRLQRVAKSRIRLIALSATLGDLPRSAAWLRPDAPDQVEILTDEATQKSVKFRIHAYLPYAELADNGADQSGAEISPTGEGLEQESQTSGSEIASEDADVEVSDSSALKERASDLDDSSHVAEEGTDVIARQQIPDNSVVTRAAELPQQTLPSAKKARLKKSARKSTAGLPPQMLRDMYEYFHGQKNLIFANSKSLVELCADGLNHLCRQHGIRPEFLVHHGSLSKEIREETESLMQGKLPYSAVCSATLELGIDIGNVAAVGQIGAPHSVNSMAQRLGRSGRKDGEPHCMRVFLKSSEVSPQSPLQDQLYPELVQAVALTEFLLQKWFEPPELDHGDFSTFVQQTLSVLAETGGVRAAELFDRLALHGAFRYVDQPTFVALLRSLAGHDLIEQMPEGDLILGLAGQKIVSHYDFYSAFASAVEFRVLYQSRLIGTLPSENVPHQGESLMLGGGRWQVTEVYRERREVSVIPAGGRKAPGFLPSERPVHPKVRQRMREILASTQAFPYLNSQANQMLSRAREAAQKSGVLLGKILDLSDSKSVWFPWTGTKAIRTLEALASLAGMKAHQAGHPVIALEFPLPAAEVVEKLEQFLRTPPTPLQLAEQLQPKSWRKYDEYLSESLLNQGLARGTVDLENALVVLAGVV
jgi:ATP-dependent Lhr-like helicase